MQYFGFDRPSFGFRTFGFGDKEYDPATLFAVGVQGAWYESSDLSTLFQDAAMTIPVTAHGDPVGAIKDKSGNGNHIIISVSTSRPIYQTNGTLHWLQADGVDDYLDTANLVPFNGNQFYTAMGVNVQTSQGMYKGLFRFLREGGSPISTSDNYLEEYHQPDRKTVAQRYPSTKVIFDVFNTKPLDASYVTTTYNSGISESQVLPIQSTEGVAVTGLASGNATLSLFRGYRGDFMKGRIFSFVWVSGAVTPDNRRKVEQYLAAKSGVTL